ncbi:hypothetical protein, partial [Ilumatobacter sp.]|uniref:hypothetical protein n=1 Tax=Ilumatobacter sp. TaxID=1967498 RepID=UPI003AF5DA7C
MGGCLTFVGTPIFDGRPVHAIAAIEIEASPLSAPTYWLEDVAVEVVVTNAGTEPLTDVTVDAYHDGGAYVRLDGAVTGPTGPAGNGDDVLDVGEQWTYDATVPAFSTEFKTTAATTDASRVEDLYWMYPFGLFSGGPTGGGLRHPILIEFESEPDPPVVGESVQWSITFTNQIDVELFIGVGRYRVGSPWVSPGPWQALGVPSDPGDGDDVLVLGESLRWEVMYPVEVEETYVEVDSNYGMVAIPSGLKLSGRSDQPIGPVSTTTTTTSTASTTTPTTTPTT